MSYISSNENRLYVAAEQNYGQVSSIESGNRIPAVKLATKQQAERPERKDKTGSRTFPGIPWGLRRRTTFELTTYLTGWTQQSVEPGYGPLFRAGLGAGPAWFNGGTAGAGSSGRILLARPSYLPTTPKLKSSTKTVPSSTAFRSDLSIRLRSNFSPVGR